MVAQYISLRFAQEEFRDRRSLRHGGKEPWKVARKVSQGALEPRCGELDSPPHYQRDRAAGGDLPGVNWI
jgi:hypothetical protein